MVQSLEAVLTKLQKIYQIKSVELEGLQKESEIKKIAFVITHLKDAEEISSFDMEKLKTFLSFLADDIDFENVNLACAVVSTTENPAIKMGRRYLDALELLKRIRGIAEEYLDVQKELPIKLAACEKSLAEMEDLFNVLANKVIVEDIEKYLNILENELFPDDIHTVLTVVAAIVIRNATILENTDLSGRPEKAVIAEKKDEVILTDLEQQKISEVKGLLNANASRYETKKDETVTNLYLKNIESLIERSKITMDEAKDMLRTGDSYEYFLWNWLGKLANKIEKSSNKTDIKDAFRQIESLLPKYKEYLEKPVVEETIEIEPVEVAVEEVQVIETPTEEIQLVEVFEEVVPLEVQEIEVLEEITPVEVGLAPEVIQELPGEPAIQSKEIIYNVSSTNEEDSFRCDSATPETIKLIEQLKEGRDTNAFSNISVLENDFEVITGDTEFLLFKKMPNGHNFVLLNGKKNEMESKLSDTKLEQFASASILPAIHDIIMKNETEYQQLTSITEKVEELFQEKGLKTVV